MILPVIAALTGCAQPRPILYPNARLDAVGREQAEREIAECRQLAEAAGATAGAGTGEAAARGTVGGGALGGATGAVGGAVVGRAGSGAAIGAASGATAGLLRGLFGGGGGPSPAYRQFVDRCLAERGYEPVGWE
ncbi:MAG TPA: glycine zipper family protein [Geminicoccaceae bacterium]|nr:glycine zipper family protein [Geminicoccaceae bacterium]